MKTAHQGLLALIICCILPLHSHAEAPVVDDSENFAILDEQQAASQQSVEQAQFDDDNLTDEEVPLAKDNVPSGDNNAVMVDKLQGMKQEIQELRGQLEVQAHDLKLLQQQQLAFYKDLDNRLRNPAAKTTPAAPVTTTPAPATTLSLDSQTTTAPKPASVVNKPTAAVIAPTSNTSNPADEQISYLAAYDLVKNKRYDEALIAMQTFVSNYPKGGYTANAQYWLGELYMVKKDYTKAIEHFEVVLKYFPTSSKSAACSLKIGYALAASGKSVEAKQRLKEVIKNFPDTPTAQLAAAKLKSLNEL